MKLLERSAGCPGGVGWRGGAAAAAGPSGLPELQQAVLAVGADQVLVGVVGDADHVLLVDLQQGGGGETLGWRGSLTGPPSHVMGKSPVLKTAQLIELLITDNSLIS